MLKAFLLLILPCLVYSQKRINNKIHPINVRAIQYHYLNKNKVTTLRPIDRIKITFKFRANFRGITNKIKVDELVVGQIQGAFVDLDMDDYVNIVRYDLRFKYYLNYRKRIVFRMQFLGLNKNWYTIGLQIKFKPKKKKIAREL